MPAARRKPAHSLNDEEALSREQNTLLAIEQVRSGQSSQAQAARDYDIPVSTLARRLRGNKGHYASTLICPENYESMLLSAVQPETIELSPEEETALVADIQSLLDKKAETVPAQYIQMIGRSNYLEKHKESIELDDDWLDGFLQRHPELERVGFSVKLNSAYSIIPRVVKEVDEKEESKIWSMTDMYTDVCGVPMLFGPACCDGAASRRHEGT